MHAMIDALPEDLRVPLALSAFDELRSPEIGAILGIPEGTVRTRLQRARQILHQKTHLPPGVALCMRKTTWIGCSSRRSQAMARRTDHGFWTCRAHSGPRSRASRIRNRSALKIAQPLPALGRFSGSGLHAVDLRLTEVCGPGVYHQSASSPQPCFIHEQWKQSAGGCKQYAREKNFAHCQTPYAAPAHHRCRQGCCSAEARCVPSPSAAFARRTGALRFCYASSGKAASSRPGRAEKR